MSDFTNLVKARRSATKFFEGTEIADSELEEIFQLAKFAPSTFNLQHTHYLVVKDQERKELVYEAANRQYKVKTASAAIVVLGDLEAYKQVDKLNEGFLHLGIMNKQEYDQTVEFVNGFYERQGDVFKREEAIRNASLSAMLLMLIAKEKGWDTCPMNGFDPQKLSQSLNIPSRYVPVLLITIGKEDTSSQRPRGYRKPTGEFVHYNTIS
ncbi:nitroreductase family protein [Brevibacillus fluminis]|uniref:Nitroreductase family protein n=1 Tax=Brevibacillus fluminis TaxID=511487 RepID=A0A3M8DHQ6_9BACL|nr:nitroreductase family protein [Brevibacillus fluminis]RNB87623.1 nitroreductase family protein [Brevibacillus fluminis]